MLATVPLRVSLQDLLSAEKKGKWWLVGAGWSGNPLVEREAALFEKAPERGPKRRAVVPEDETILELARKQGMNTDIRRSVFLVLMTSEVRRPRIVPSDLTAGRTIRTHAIA